MKRTWNPALLIAALGVVAAPSADANDQTSGMTGGSIDSAGKAREQGLWNWQTKLGTPQP